MDSGVRQQRSVAPERVGVGEVELGGMELGQRKRLNVTCVVGSGEYERPRWRFEAYM